MSAFAQLLGIRAGHNADNRAISEMTPGDTAMGRPSAMHGGAVAGLIEQAGRATVLEALDQSGAAITLITMTVDYLRAAPMRECCARGNVVKLGGRIANISVEA